MGKIVEHKNVDRFIQLGIAVAALRKIRGLSQEDLAEKANIGRSHLANIESPNLAYNFTLNTLFNIADALDVPPEKLIAASIFPDDMLK